jgi:hypothetical protein
VGYPKGGAHPKLVGDRSTAMVLARLLEIYDVILLPFGENQRYDLVVEYLGSFIRVQCKTGRLYGDVIHFNACSSVYHHPNAPQRDDKSRDYRGAADFFGVYCRENDSVYLVPVEVVGTRSGTLRLGATRNSQQKGVRWARDYLVAAGMRLPLQGELGRGLEPLA